MSLTRNQWIELWATTKAMEYDLLHFPYSELSPYNRTEQRKIVQATLKNIKIIKNQIQSVIGQME
jgi:hypothetical protein